MAFFAELKRRNVVRMALLYVVAGWVMLQIADVLFVPLGLPEWTFRLVFGLLVLGFPFALIFAWVFELTPEGLKRERDVDRSRSAVTQTGRKMNAIIIVLLVVAIAGVVADRLIPETAAPGADAAATGVAETRDDVAAAPEATDPTIAVLPFVNISDDPDNEYFSDGLTEELLNTLVRLGGLKVTGRTSSFAFKGQNRDLREIGELLNVANVLEGSVRKAGNQVRITAQLVKTSDGYHLWSDTFDRELDDIFAIQQEIADQVSEVLQVTLLGEEPDEATSRVHGDIDPEAYEEYLRGMYIWQKAPDAKTPLERARANFESALAIEPDYADAHWGLFLVWDRMHRNANYPFDEALERVRYYAAKLQELAPGSDRALSAAARLALLKYEFDRAVALLEESVERHPGNVTVLNAFANVLPITGQYDRALVFADRAGALDPLSLDIMRIQSFILYRKGDCAGAKEVMNRALGIEPEAGRFRYYVAMCLYETTGDAAAALPIAEQESLNWANDTALAILYRELGDEVAAQGVLDDMVAAYGDGASYQYAQIHAQWGETDAALGWLETAVAVRDPGLVQAGDDRLLAPLQGEPRFEQVLSDVGFR